MKEITQNGGLVDAPCTILQHNFSFEFAITSYRGSEIKIVDTYEEGGRTALAGQYCVAVWRVRPKSLPL